jgi:hypothetical protein
MEILMSACSTYVNNLNLPGKQKRAVYQTETGDYDATDYPHDDFYDSGYNAHHVDTDILETLVNNNKTNYFGNNCKSDKAQEKFLPRDQWDKLTQ